MYLLKSIDYFKASLLDPFFAVEEILHNPEHSTFKDVQFDLTNIDSTDMSTFIVEHEVDKFLETSSDYEKEALTHYLIYRIQTQIASDRLSALTDNAPRPKPYDSKNLINLDIDKNNLVDIGSFNLGSGGFKYNDYIYNLTPVTNGSNSSYWLTQALIKYAEEGLPFKIRLDPFIEIAAAEYNPMMYKMHVYGKELDWARLSSLQSIEDGKWLDEKPYSNIGITDFVWIPSQTEVHFTCEELPKAKSISVRGSRYFHAIFDKKSKKITHCDGAIRIYDHDSFDKRSQYHVKNSEVTKIGKRVKIFQVDSPISEEVFGYLITNFFVWNYDIMGYFGAE